MGCFLHPEAVNIPAIAGEDLWFCGHCGTAIKGKDIEGGRKVGKKVAIRRWKIYKARTKDINYEVKKGAKGEALKGDRKGGNRIIRGKNRRKKR